ncbi:hypothetical protein [Paenibacillus sp. F4]|nr:hypothetical protein [Paenibacillus sp. F4]
MANVQVGDTGSRPLQRAERDDDAQHEQSPVTSCRKAERRVS